MIVLLLVGVACAVLLTFRSPRWRRAGRIVAIVGVVLAVFVLIAGMIAAGSVG